jgi:uncharacterized protein (TIGR03790 family)
MRYALVLSLLATTASSARAELKPEEIAILAMAESPQSCKLAEHYAAVRGVPKTQILRLPGKPAVTVGREAWETSLRPTIRAWLKEKGLETKIRCMVTCWDVPLKIDRRSPQSPVVVERQRELTRTRAGGVKQVAELVKALDALAAGKELSPPRPALEMSATLADLTGQYEPALQAAQERIRAIESEAERQKAHNVLERLFAHGAGLGGLARAAGGPDAAKLQPELRERLEFLRGQVQGLTEGLQALGNLPDTASRDRQMFELLLKTGGILGVIQWVDQQQELLKKNETYAAFDSELSLLHWPDYPLFGWQPNMLFYRYDPFAAGRTHVLMVARLEAPTFERAMGLVDTAVAVEKTGLVGKFYIDARGIGFNAASDKPGSYGQFDQSLRDLAERLKRDTKLEVVFDNDAKLFGEKACPDAALYCGWYSLAKYVDSFTWRPGAVGYHIASAEAETIRTPGSTVWCNAMLERGVCATLGPTFEPYLAAFPLPDDFFPLLLTGRHTLAECYFRTLPLSSWAMVLVGDPLYNPFKKHPPLKEEDLPERLREKK